MDKRKTWWAQHRPTKRRLIQVYSALLYNAHIKGFINGEIFTGVSKNVCVPGLNCYSCPGALGACPLGALQNALASSGKRAPFYVFGILALFGLIFGRTVCGWLCPVGLIQELLHKIPTPKITKSRVTRALSCLKYILLICFVIAIPVSHIGDGVPVPGFCKYICPAGTLEGAVGLLANSANGKLFGALGALFTQKFIIMVSVFTLAVFAYRAFCRFLCPLGAIYGLFSKIALLGVKVDNEKCTGCGLCVASCGMDVKHVGDHECIHCGRCMAVCPEKAISWKHGKPQLKENGVSVPRKKEPALTVRNILTAVIAAAVLVWAVWYGNFSKDAQGAPGTSPFTAEEGRTVGSETGMRCPGFEVPLYKETGTVTLSDCLGKPTVIHFWATWCGGCVTELPEFQRFYEAYGDRVNVIAVHSKELTEDVDAFLAANGYTFRFALDERGTMLSALGGSAALPQTVVLDADGTVVYNRIGPADFSLLEAVVLPLLRSEMPGLPGKLPAIPGKNAGKARYLITVEDQTGTGVPGVKLQVCTDVICLLYDTDGTGTVEFTDAAYAYEVHVISVPEGYTADTEMVYTLNAGGDTLVITAEKEGAERALEK